MLPVGATGTIVDPDSPLDGARVVVVRYLENQWQFCPPPSWPTSDDGAPWLANPETGAPVNPDTGLDEPLPPTPEPVRSFDPSRYAPGDCVIVALLDDVDAARGFVAGLEVSISDAGVEVTSGD